MEKDACQNKAGEENEKEPESGKADRVNSDSEDEEEMPQEGEEKAEDVAEAESEVEKAKGEAVGDEEAEFGETSGEVDEEAVEEAGLVSDASGVEEEREEGEDEEMADADEGQTETAEEETATEEGQDENGNQADFDDESSNTSTASPFKKPSFAANSDRKRHMSVDSSSNLSESSESSAVSSHHKADRQAYQQQLAFYRTPMVGRETVCIFCLTKCTPDRDPKLLTCLHSSCAECFRERVELAAGERKAMQCVEDDDISAVQEDLTVACPLCKVSGTIQFLQIRYFLRLLVVLSLNIWRPASNMATGCLCRKAQLHMKLIPILTNCYVNSLIVI